MRAWHTPRHANARDGRCMGVRTRACAWGGCACGRSRGSTRGHATGSRTQSRLASTGCACEGACVCVGAAGARWLRGPWRARTWLSHSAVEERVGAHPPPKSRPSAYAHAHASRARDEARVSEARSARPCTGPRVPCRPWTRAWHAPRLVRRHRFVVRRLAAARDSRESAGHPPCALACDSAGPNLARGPGAWAHPSARKPLESEPTYLSMWGPMGCRWGAEQARCAPVGGGWRASRRTSRWGPMGCGWGAEQARCGPMGCGWGVERWGPAGGG